MTIYIPTRNGSPLGTYAFGGWAYLAWPTKQGAQAFVTASLEAAGASVPSVAREAELMAIEAVSADDWRGRRVVWGGTVRTI